MTPPHQDDQQQIVAMLFEIRERLVAIETRQEDSKDAKDKAYEALSISKENEKDICEIKEGQKWTVRTIAVLVGAALLNFIVNAMQGL